MNNEETQPIKGCASSGERCSLEEEKMQVLTIRHIKGKINQALANKGKIVPIGIKEFPMFLCYIDNNVYTLLFNDTDTKKFVGPREVLKFILQRVLKVEERRYTSVTTIFLVETPDEPLVLFFERNGEKELPYTTMECWEEIPEEASIRGIKESLGITLNSYDFVTSVTEVNEYGDPSIFNLIKVKKGHVGVRFTHNPSARVDLVGFVRLSKVDELIDISTETIQILKDKWKKSTMAK